jgi:protein gp37
MGTAWRTFAHLGGNWRQPLKWARQAYGHRPRVFCASLADVFDNKVPKEWRGDLWELIRKTPDLDWMLLTKRPENIRRMLPNGWPWDHVWLGTTTEEQGFTINAGAFFQIFPQRFVLSAMSQL